MKVSVLASSLDQTAKLLSTRHNIRVRFEPGAVPKTDGKTITLPEISERCDPAFVEALHGYLDHETAHVLFTNFDLKPANKAEFGCVNVVEDIRIEKKFCAIYPGAALNLDTLFTFVSKNVKLDAKAHPAAAILAALYARHRSTGVALHASVISDAALCPYLQACEAILDNAVLNSTEDSHEVGARIYQVLEPLFPTSEKTVPEESNKANQAEDAAGAQDKAEKSDTPMQVLDVSAAGKFFSSEASAVKLGKASKFGYQHDLTGAKTYEVFSKSRDVFIRMPDKNEPMEDFSSIVHVMKTRLVNDLRTASRSRWISNREDGRLDCRKLSRAVVSGATNVYKTKTDALKLDTAVVLAIDHSGSMHGDKLALAGNISQIFGEVLACINVPFMVYGYSTITVDFTPPDRDRYARWNRLWIGTYKEFGEPWSTARTRCSSMDDNVKMNTLDGESILYGARQLVERPEKNKILFVLNDGKPEPRQGNQATVQKHLKATVQAITEARINVVALGIQDDSVRHYYPKHIVVQNLQELEETALQQLSALLRKGLKRGTP